MIVAAEEGHYLISDDDRRIYDSLWCCGAGHNVPEIQAAASDKFKRLDYAPGFQFGHPDSFYLAECVAVFMPEGLDRVFFTNSGSESVDTRPKIARAYWRAKGQANQTRLIGLPPIKPPMLLRAC